MHAPPTPLPSPLQFVSVLDRWGAVTVGATMLVIGATGLKDAWEAQREALATGGAHPTAHAHVEEVAAGVGARSRRMGTLLGTFVTGVVYGLQPDALFVILPALTLPSRAAATSYILSFVLGTVMAMAAYAGVIGASPCVGRGGSFLSRMPGGRQRVLGEEMGGSGARTSAGRAGTDVPSGCSAAWQSIPLPRPCRKTSPPALVQARRRTR